MAGIVKYSVSLFDSEHRTGSDGAVENRFTSIGAAPKKTELNFRVGSPKSILEKRQKRRFDQDPTLLKFKYFVVFFFCSSLIKPLGRI